MSDEKFAEFKRIWGVDGMPADKIKLATAAFTDGRAAGIAWAEKFTAEQCIEVIRGCGITIFHIDGQIKMQNQIVKAIKEKFGLEI